MSKISPLMGVNARFGKEVRQTANALKKTTAGRIKLSGIQEVAKDTRAVFPELPAPKSSAPNILA